MKVQPYPIWRVCGNHKFKTITYLEAWVYVFTTPILEQAKWFV